MAQWFIALAIDVVTALVIVGVALWLAGWAKARIDALPDRNPRFDRTLARFLGGVARYAILIIAVVFVLGQFGLQTTSLAAVIGASVLAIGLAMQGTLANVAAGVMLVMFRPFKVGDYVTAAGQSGTVEAISLFFTELQTPDNVRIIVPNGDIWATAITNYSHYATRRCDMVFGVSYDTDLKKAEQIIRECIEADSRAHAEPEPFVKVTNLGDFSVDFTARVWCDAGDYWNMKFDLTRAVKEAFDAGGVEIPFPTQTQLNIPL